MIMGDTEPAAAQPPAEEEQTPAADPQPQQPAPQDPDDDGVKPDTTYYG
jgi:hypothetical protein